MSVARDRCVSHSRPRDRPVDTAPMANRRVLVVEDDDDARVGLVSWLSSEGFDAKGVATGREAIEEHHADYDAVVIDYGLPDVDGFEVMRRLRIIAPTLPAIMLTGRSSITHAVESMKRGAFHYATKPVDFGELTRVLHEAVAVRRSSHRFDPSAAIARSESTMALAGSAAPIEAVDPSLPKQDLDRFVLPGGGVDMQRVERELLVQALERTRGNVTRAAKLLGMSRDQVRYRIQKFALEDH